MGRRGVPQLRPDPSSLVPPPSLQTVRVSVPIRAVSDGSPSGGKRESVLLAAGKRLGVACVWPPRVTCAGREGGHSAGREPPAQWHREAGAAPKAPRGRLTQQGCRLILLLCSGLGGPADGTFHRGGQAAGQEQVTEVVRSQTTRAGYGSSREGEGPGPASGMQTRPRWPDSEMRDLRARRCPAPRPLGCLCCRPLGRRTRGRRGWRLSACGRGG